AQSRPLDGIGGLRFHAASAAGRIRPIGSGRRRGRLLSAQQHLRFQRCGDTARRGFFGLARRTRDAAARMNLMSSPNVIAAFSQTYAEARAKFLAAAKARGLTVESHVHPSVRGVDGETLAVDVALLGGG